MLRRFAFSFILASLISPLGFAEKIDFPDDELATESVLPKFDVLETVKNRNIVTSNKMEVGVFLGWNTDEAIFNQSQYGLSGSYHFDENHGVNLLYSSFGSGTSSYAKDIQSSVGLDYSKAVGPSSYWLANYQFTGYYGKMSLGKETNFNLHIFGLIGVGQMNYEGLSNLCFDIGIGEKFYITKNAGIRAELKFLRYNGPNPASVSKTQLNSGSLTAQDFDSMAYFMTNLNLGFIYLF